MTALHARMQQAGSRAVLTGGLSRRMYAAALAMVALLAIAMIGLLIRALATGLLGGAAFIAGFAALFGWQVGGFIRRNRPLVYTFDTIPKSLLP
jgi:predicted ABC-type sugar transport system permease subunit